MLTAAIDLQAGYGILAVRGMMPRNVISKDSMSRLKIYRGGEHEHAAQKPELWAL